MEKITSYSNYRLFLKDLIEHKKKNDSSFSVSKLAEKIGMSHSLIKMVLTGHRNLSGEPLFKMLSALNFNFEEKVFFEVLVQENQASSQEEREFHKKRRQEAKKESKVSSQRIGKEFALDQWYYPALLLYLLDIERVSEKKFSDIDCERIQKIFSMSKEELNCMLQSFEDSGYLNIQEDGKIQFCLDNVGSTMKRQSFILKVIEESLQRGKDSFNGEGNYFSADTISISQSEIQNFVKDYQHLISKYIGRDLIESDQTKITQLAFQMFSIN